MNTCHAVVVFLVLLKHAVTRALKSIGIETEQHRRNSKSLVKLVCRNGMWSTLHEICTFDAMKKWTVFYLGFYITIFVLFIPYTWLDKYFSPGSIMRKKATVRFWTWVGWKWQPSLLRRKIALQEIPAAGWPFLRFPIHDSCLLTGPHSVAEKQGCAGVLELWNLSTKHQPQVYMHKKNIFN